jgi:hypothetical protein
LTATVSFIGRDSLIVVGAYLKQGAVVSTSYNTIDFVRTMEEVLGLKQFLNLNDALGHPMTDIFTTTPQAWSFTPHLPLTSTLRNCRFQLLRLG